MFNLFIPLSSTPVSPQTIGFLTLAIFWKVSLPPGVLMLFALILVFIKFVKRKFDSYENLEAHNALS